MRFYVYRILGEQGETVYVGKGKGRRLANQKWRFKAEGEVLKRFATERAALNYECKLIAKLNPPLNQLAGGGGALERIKVQRLQVGERAAPRAYVARMLCNRFWIYLSPDKAADIRKVAGYDRAWSLSGSKEVTGYGRQAWSPAWFASRVA